MLISIVIPIYNSAKYLKKLLAILTTNPVDCEIILVNDGSTDNSGSICSKYARKFKYIHYIEQDNMGVAVARNNGLKVSKGKYILFLDSDDYPEENITERLSKVLFEKEPVFLSYGYDLVNGNNTIIRPSLINAKFKKFNDLESVKKYFCNYAEDNQINCVYNKVFNRKIIESNDIQFRNMRFGEDVCFVCDYLKVTYGKCVFMEDILYHIVQNPNSITHTYSDRRYTNELEVISTIEECAIKFNNSEKGINRLIQLKFKKAYLYEIYNLASVDCYMKFNEKYKYLKKIYYDFSNNKKLVPRSKDSYFSRRERIILFCFYRKWILAILVYLELKRIKWNK